MDSHCKLSTKKCVPCHKDIPPLKGQELAELHKQLGNGWTVVDEHHLEKEYRFPDFRQALIFTNKVGAIAEEEGHHPDVLLSYGKVKIQLWTHKIDGLSESDFVLAAKCDEVDGSPHQQEVVKAYLHALEKGNYEEVVKQFTHDAVVHSPLYGEVEAIKFYRQLFSDTKSSKIELKTIFSSHDNPHCVAAHFVYTWRMKDDAVVQFECVDLFELSPQNVKIKSLTIIYDTYHTRKKFANSHPGNFTG